MSEWVRTYHGHYRLAIVAALLIVTLPACTTVRGPEPPEITLVDLKVEEMTMLETTLQVTVRVSNPNPDPLALEGAAFKLRLDGHKVGSGMTPDELTVPRLESRTLQIAFHLSNPATILRLPTIVDSRSVDWSLNGKLYVRTSLGRRTLKVAQQGHLDLGELEEPSDARLSPGEEIQ